MNDKSEILFKPVPENIAKMPFKEFLKNLEAQISQLGPGEIQTLLYPVRGDTPGEFNPEIDLSKGIQMCTGHPL